MSSSVCDIGCTEENTKFEVKIMNPQLKDWTLVTVQFSPRQDVQLPGRLLGAVQGRPRLSQPRGVRPRHRPEPAQHRRAHPQGTYTITHMLLMLQDFALGYCC